MEYKAKIVGMRFKQVEAKGAKRVILTVKYGTDEGNKVQDLWYPTGSTSEKATDFFWNTLETIGLPKEGFKKIKDGDWKGALLKPEMEFSIETEVDKNGYEKVKYVNDPANPRSSGAEVTDPDLLDLLGISEGASDTDEIPF